MNKDEDVAPVSRYEEHSALIADIDEEMDNFLADVHGNLAAFGKPLENLNETLRLRDPVGNAWQRAYDELLGRLTALVNEKVKHPADREIAMRRLHDRAAKEISHCEVVGGADVYVWLYGSMDEAVRRWDTSPLPSADE
ncbi:MAG: hypothetical protein RR101_14725 [Burkholderiaceae bacterium]